MVVCRLPFAAFAWRVSVCACLLAASLTACSDAATTGGEALDAANGANDAILTDLLANFADAVDVAADVPADGVSGDIPAGVCTTAGAPWCPCKENADCDGGFCLDTPTGHVCAAKCVDQCPEGFACSGVNIGGGDISTICVPRWGWLCEPCSTNGDCDSPGVGKQAACLDYGDAGHFCGYDCTNNSDCPSGYTCGDGKTVDGATRKQCTHNGVCDCSPRAVALQASTMCYASDATSGAKCQGTRHCGANGLEPCSAKPGKEICNGLDDDCDGKTDIGACDDQNACTQDICDAATGVCTHNALDGSPCDADGTACTVDDTCQAGVCKPGVAKTCSDANPCTDDTCNPASGCAFTNNSAPCDDGKACTVGDACAGGSCTPGASNGCDDGNSCTDQTCDPKTGNCTTTFNALNCDDGNACSSNDHCQGGVCKAGPTVDCTDADLCTLDSCDVAGGCKHTVGTGVCDDGDACTFGETCATGVCNGGALLSCDDLNPCTADSCDKLSGCVHTAQNGACDDKNACTSNDVCAGGSCSGALNGPCASDLNPCTTDQCDPASGCVYVNNTAPCDDGTVCTQNDMCAGGGCVGGAALVCNDDGNPCTTEVCNPVSGCGSINNTAACDDGNACTLSDSCSGGSCQPGLPKDCSGLSTTCGDGKCSNGNCYLDPYAIETTCPTGLCDGLGACVTPGTYTIDGCTGANYVNCASWNCFGCKEENGFTAYNTTDCEGTGCFDRFPTFGQNGFVVMEAQWAATAYVDWKFPQTLIGKYKIQAYIPVAIPASVNGGACAADSSTTYATKALYEFKTAGNDLISPVSVNHQTAKGTLVTLYTGDATGLTHIRLSNGPSATKPPACQFYLVDAIVATPQ